MSELTQFLESYGYILFPALGFVEFAGLPVASVPLLVAAGALGAAGMAPTAPLMVVLVALGGWAADLAWYGVGRARGEELVDFACGLTSNRDACVLGVEARLKRLGVVYIMVSKFIPGAGNLMASAAGIAAYPARAFLFADAIALVLWSSAWIGLGFLIGEPVVAAVALVVDYANLVLVAVVVAVVSAFLWRVVRVRRHRRMHAEHAADSDSEPAESH